MCVWDAFGGYSCRLPSAAAAPVDAVSDGAQQAPVVVGKESFYAVDGRKLREKFYFSSPTPPTQRKESFYFKNKNYAETFADATVKNKETFYSSGASTNEREKFTMGSYRGYRSQPGPSGREGFCGCSAGGVM